MGMCTCMAFICLPRHVLCCVLVWLSHYCIFSTEYVYLYKFSTLTNTQQDLYHLIKKAVNVRKHLEKNRKDTDSKFRLILIESRIHRLARYYKKAKTLPPTWRYNSQTASALVA
jgi:ribosomal protein S15P/S13E